MSISRENQGNEEAVSGLSCTNIPRLKDQSGWIIFLAFELACVIDVGILIVFVAAGRFVVVSRALLATASVSVKTA